MSILVSTFSGLLTDALTIGAVIGALAGIVVFTADSASEGIQRVIFGIIVGGIIMGVIQAALISGIAGQGLGSRLNPMLQEEVGPFGSVVYRALVLTVQAALAGGLFMVISLAPFRAFKGALAGVIIGTVAALLSWFALRYIATPIPLVVYYALVLGLVVFIVENLPRGR